MFGEVKVEVDEDELKEIWLRLWLRFFKFVIKIDLYGFCSVLERVFFGVFFLLSKVWVNFLIFILLVRFFNGVILVLDWFGLVGVDNFRIICWINLDFARGEFILWMVIEVFGFTDMLFEFLFDLGVFFRDKRCIMVFI